jgi:pimeloyl-ACP methyl ester carboxylesterase
MPRAAANGIELEYDSFGRASDRPLLLIMGLGAQMLQWDERFCEALAERGQYVIRFDNRDVGLSTKFDHAGIPDLAALM